MRTHTAKTLDEIRDVKELADGDTWAHARKFLQRAPRDRFAHHYRWMTDDDGAVVAGVQVFLHQYRIGDVTLGMLLPELPFVPPELRGRGHFKRLMADLFAWAAEAGYPLAYSHGRKGLYTGIGYAPCMQHCQVMLRVADAKRLVTAAIVEPATEADVAANEKMFRWPFPLGRGLQCRDEAWRPQAEIVRLVRDDQDVRGFAVLADIAVGKCWAGLRPPDGNDMLTITDAWAEDARSAAALLKGIAEEADLDGAEWLLVNTERYHELARIAVLAGGQLRWSAGQERDCTGDGEDVDAFYLVDLPLAIRQLLPEMDTYRKAVGTDMDFPPAVCLATEDQEVTLALTGGVSIIDAVADAPRIRLPRKAMVRAIMGYAGFDELAVLHEGCQMPPGCRRYMSVLFGRSEPHLIHENTAFAGPAGFGLVP